MELLFFKTQEDFANWLEKNHDSVRELWVGYYKKATKKASITWDESVEAAIRFGWIDGLRKSIDGESYKIRFTPRKPQSIWSLKNIKTVEGLIEKDLMCEPGMQAYKLRKEKKTGVYAYEKEEVPLSTEFETQFKKHEKAWAFFTSQAPSYQRTATHWVMSAKQEKTQHKRLNDLIESSENELRAKPFRRK